MTKNPKSEPLPDTTAEELRWKCFCGHWDSYANRDAHLAIHKRELHKREKEKKR